MRVRKGLAVSVAAMAIAIGSDSERRTAQSFTIPTECVDSVVCASLCRGAVEQGRTESDFVALATYELGPERPIPLPPANVSMPAQVDPHNVYAGTGAGMFSPAVAGHLSRVYSPNLLTGRVDVIDPETFTVIDSLAAVPSPQHIVPSWDLQTLWVSGDISYRGGHADVMPIDPKTGKLGKAIDVPNSYNMYFTPDGKSAIVVAEAMRRLEFRDPHTMELQGYIAAPQCPGLNHADFSPDGSYAIFTCEYGNALAKIDLTPSCAGRDAAAVARRHAAGHPHRAGRLGLLCRRHAEGRPGRHRRRRLQGNRLHLDRGRRARALPEPRRNEALCRQPRNAQSRRPEEWPGSVSVLDFKTRQVVANWTIPGGGSPDMGNLSADGKWLWLSGRYDGVIYAFNTDDGSVKSIPVGGMPHGLTVWPQPGRYSLGHTGNMR